MQGEIIELPLRNVKILVSKYLLLILHATNDMIRRLLSREVELIHALGRSAATCTRSFSRHFSRPSQKKSGDEQSVQNNITNERPLREWEKRDASIKKRFGSWNPTRKLSRQKMQEMRDLTVSMPHLRTIDLANMYNISPEAVRRILESRWVPKLSEEDAVLQRYEKYKEKRRALHKAATTEIATANEKMLHVEAIEINNLIDPRLLGGNQNLQNIAQLRSRRVESVAIRKPKRERQRSGNYLTEPHRQPQRRAISTGDLID